MSQYIKPVTANLTFCEGFGCNNEATAEIEVNAGKFGILVLNLCVNCAVKFEEKGSRHY